MLMFVGSFKGLNRVWQLINQGKRLKDSLALGFVGSFLGTVAMVISNFLIYKAGKTEILYGNIAGSIFMRPFRTRQRKNFILGQIFHMLTGSGAGVVMVLVFKRFGTDLTLLKGFMLGMFTWETLYNVGQRLGIYTARPHLTKTGYSALWNNFVYGVVTAYSIRWLAHPSVFPSNRQISKQQENIDSQNHRSSGEQAYATNDFEDTPSRTTPTFH